MEPDGEQHLLLWSCDTGFRAVPFIDSVRGSSNMYVECSLRHVVDTEFRVFSDIS